MSLFVINRELEDGRTLVLTFCRLFDIHRSDVVLDRAMLYAPREPRKRSRSIEAGWCRLPHEARGLPLVIEKPVLMQSEIEQALEHFRSQIRYV